jgi:hypothetical protein
MFQASWAIDLYRCNMKAARQYINEWLDCVPVKHYVQNPAVDRIVRLMVVFGVLFKHRMAVQSLCACELSLFQLCIYHFSREPWSEAERDAQSLIYTYPVSTLLG